MIQLPGESDERRRLEMLQSLGLSDTQDPSLRALADLAADLARAPTALVSLIESDRVAFVGSKGFDASTIDRQDSFCIHVLQQPDPIFWISDARLDPRFSSNRYVVGDPCVRFFAGVPLRVNGCMVGTLSVVDSEPRAFDTAVAAHLQLVARACTAELEERHRTNAIRQALFASADALIDCDTDGIICNWCDGAQSLFGFSREEAMGAEIAIIIPPEHRDNHREGMRRWKASGAARLGRRLELPAMRRDGSTLDIELWMSVSHDNGEARVHANVRDISERRAQARELADAKVCAEDANRAKTAFLANMSHELRTPLNGVTACTGLLAASPLDPDQRRLVDIVETASDQLGRLIGDLLDMARIESGELRLDPTPVDLGLMIDRLIDLTRLRADEKGIGLRADMASGTRDVVMVDAARMKQVLGNLLANAVKFTDDGEVLLSVTRSGQRFRFEVRDTGIGFEGDEHKKIFERFQQADPTITRRFGGTGLGLAICRDLIRAMDGVMDCRSTPGEGSTFWVEVDLPAAERALQPDTDGTLPPGVTLPGLDMLVVDDNATNRQVAGLILQAADIRVTHAENGRESLTALASKAFDLVLMDMMMPEMDGVEATRRLRAGEAGPDMCDVPVIMLTANSLPEHIAQSLAAGADSHLAKPITPASLLQSVTDTLTARASGLAASSTPDAAVAG